MIELYTWSTPNGQKASIMLEEVGLPYRVHPIDIGKDHQSRHLPQQQDPRDRRHRQWPFAHGVGSDLALSRREDRQALAAGFSHQMARGRVVDVADGWPRSLPRSSSPFREIQSGKEHLCRGALHQGSKAALGCARSAARRDRICGGRLLDRRHRHLAVDFRFKWQTVTFDDYPNVKRWYTAIAARPAVQRGWNVPPREGSIPMP